jgi:hypothetical protein
MDRIRIAQLVVSVVIAAPSLGAVAVSAWRKYKKPTAEVTMSLDRNKWEFVVENVGEKDATNVFVKAVQTPRGITRVTVRDISDGLKIPVLSPGEPVRFAALREHLSTTEPAIFDVRWTDSWWRQYHHRVPFYRYAREAALRP